MKSITSPVFSLPAPPGVDIKLDWQKLKSSGKIATSWLAHLYDLIFFSWGTLSSSEFGRIPSPCTCSTAVRLVFCSGGHLGLVPGASAWELIMRFYGFAHAFIRTIWRKWSQFTLVKTFTEISAINFTKISSHAGSKLKLLKGQMTNNEEFDAFELPNCHLFSFKAIIGR